MKDVLRVAQHGGAATAREGANAEILVVLLLLVCLIGRQWRSEIRVLLVLPVYLNDRQWRSERLEGW